MLVPSKLGLHKAGGAVYVREVMVLLQCVNLFLI